MPLYATLRGAPAYDVPAVWAKAAACRRALGGAEAAAAVYEEVLRDVPRQPDASVALAEIWLELGRRESAAQVLSCMRPPLESGAGESSAITVAGGVQAALLQRRAAELFLRIGNPDAFVRLALPVVEQTLSSMLASAATARVGGKKKKRGKGVQLAAVGGAAADLPLLPDFFKDGGCVALLQRLVTSLINMRRSQLARRLVSSAMAACRGATAAKGVRGQLRGLSASMEGVATVGDGGEAGMTSQHGVGEGGSADGLEVRAQIVASQFCKSRNCWVHISLAPSTSQGGRPERRSSSFQHFCSTQPGGRLERAGAGVQADGRARGQQAGLPRLPLGVCFSHAA